LCGLTVKVVTGPNVSAVKATLVAFGIAATDTRSHNFRTNETLPLYPNWPQQ